MAMVYIPMVPSRIDHATHTWVPKVDLKPAEAFGVLNPMLPPEAGRLSSDQILSLLKTAMRDYTEHDYLLAVGDPTVLGMAACLAARATDGLLRFLKWDRQTSSYQLVEIQV